MQQATEAHPPKSRKRKLNKGKAPATLGNGPFPQPCRVGNTTRWRLSEIYAWEGLPAPVEERYVSDIYLAERYGIHRVTPWRWAREAREKNQAA